MKSHDSWSLVFLETLSCHCGHLKCGINLTFLHYLKAHNERGRAPRKERLYSPNSHCLVLTFKIERFLAPPERALKELQPGIFLCTFLQNLLSFGLLGSGEMSKCHTSGDYYDKVVPPITLKLHKLCVFIQCYHHTKFGKNLSQSMKTFG
jgi:hypothetical protein